MGTSENMRRLVLVLSSDGKTRVIAEHRSQSNLHPREFPSTDSNHGSHYSYNPHTYSRPSLPSTMPIPHRPSRSFSRRALPADPNSQPHNPKSKTKPKTEKSQ